LCGMAGSGSWLWAIRLLGSGAICPPFRLALVALVGHHTFMGSDAHDDMTKGHFLPRLSAISSLLLTAAERLAARLSGQRGVDIVNTRQRATCPPPGRRPAFWRVPPIHANRGWFRHDRVPECPRSSGWSGDTMGWRLTAPLDVCVRCGSWPERSFCSPQGISGLSAAGVVCGTEDNLPIQCCHRSEAF
jgi:hypothetical protein